MATHTPRAMLAAGAQAHGARASLPLSLPRALSLER